MIKETYDRPQARQVARRSSPLALTKRLAARQDQLPLQLARDAELEQILVIKLEQKTAINSGVGKGADMHVQTVVPKPLAHRVLSPGVCWLNSSCLSGVCSRWHRL